MRSFRLDPDSVAELRDSWPVLVLGGLLACLFAHLGRPHLGRPIVGVLIGGLYLGYLLRGQVGRRLQQSYPGARFVWLLSGGMATLVLGFAARMVFPQIQGKPFDLAWLGVSFFSILGFVLLNWTNPSVIR